MSNAIQFLETLGSRPALVMATFAGYEEAVDGLQCADGQREALRARDPVALGRALHGRAHMICAVCTPDDDQHEAVPDEDDKDGDMVPDDEESPARD